MRRSTDLKESPLSILTESKVLEQSSSAAPEGVGEDDHHTPSETGQRLLLTVNPNPVPKGQAEESGRHGQTLSSHS